MLHFELPFEQLDTYLALLQFGDEELFHDTFYAVGKSKKYDRQIWLRKRKNLSCVTTPPNWCLLDANEHTLNDSQHDITCVLNDHGIPFDKEEKNLEKLFPEYCFLSTFWNNFSGEECSH